MTQKENPSSYPHSQSRAMKKCVNARFPCPYEDCPRHGNCEECKVYHHKRGEKTFCGK